MSKILITAKNMPDLDGVSSMVAYKELLQELYPSNTYFTGEIYQSQPEARFVVDFLKTKEETAYLKWDEVILVDASSTVGLRTDFVPTQVIEVIDHRFLESVDILAKRFPNAKIQNENVGVAVTLVVEKFLAMSRVPKEKTSKLILAAIYSHTQNLSSEILTDRDVTILNYIKSTYEFDLEFIRQMFEFKTEYALRNLKTVLFDDGKIEDLRYFRLSALQVEVMGDEILNSKADILQILAEYNRKNDLSIGFVNIVDMQNKITYVITNDDTLKEVFTKELGFEFTQYLAKFEGLMLRKHILAKLNSKR